MWPRHPNHNHFFVLLLAIVLVATSILSIRKNNALRVNSTHVEFEETLFQLESVGNDSFTDDGALEGEDVHVVHILGLFELSSTWGERPQGVSEMRAAKMAVEHVNKVNLLPGYKLNILVNDTKCDPGVGVDRFFHALYSSKKILMLLGTGCSNVTERLAHIVPYWNILQVYDLGMFGGEYVWILQDHEESWWNSPSTCTYKQLQQTIEGIILVGDYNSVFENEIPISGMDNNQFEIALTPSSPISKYAKQSYDAVWAMALTLRQTQSHYWTDPLHLFDYKRKDMVQHFLDQMSTLKFMGQSGPVQFRGADRIGNSIVRQVQGGSVRDVAIYDSLRNKLLFDCRTCWKIKWKNGTAPIAQRTLKVTLVTIPPELFYAIASVSLLGITASLLFLCFNIHFRRMKTVKLSSPKLNNVAVCGCILVYSSVALLGMPNGPFAFENLSALCTIRVYLLSSGFSLTFGSMFAKTYRVHRLFTYYSVCLVKDKLLKDKLLIALIFVPLAIDAVILTLWVMIDPLEKQLHNLTLELSEEDSGIVYQPQVTVCQSHNTAGWYTALYGYKSLILIMGVFMAWETRHIKIPGLNDSQYVGICVYSAVFTAIVVTLCSLIFEYVIVSYLAKAVSILASATITLTLLFLPKLKTVFGKINSEAEIMQSLGLKIESNTRRFITNDPKELISRLEIQNKVYRCELAALDKEIARLEGLLSAPPTISAQIETKADCHRLQVPQVHTRASWPNTHPASTSFSEKFKEKPGILEKIKLMFSHPSLPSVQEDFEAEVFASHNKISKARSELDVARE